MNRWGEVFDFSALGARDQKALGLCLSHWDFDWNGHVRDALPALNAGNKVRVTIEHMTGMWAGTYGSPDVHIAIDDVVWPDPPPKYRPGDIKNLRLWFQQIFNHESGHVLDFLLFAQDPQSWHQKIADIYGKPWDGDPSLPDGGCWHDFNAGFTRAFSAYNAAGSHYVATPDIVANIRELLGGKGPPPKKLFAAR